MFSAYKQEANLKNFNNFQFILLTYLFRASRLHRKSHLQNW
jgi:hypothetical protein